MTLKLRAGVSMVDTDYGIAVLDEDNGQYFNFKPHWRPSPADPARRRNLRTGSTATEHRVRRGPGHRHQDGHALLVEFRSTGLILS